MLSASHSLTHKHTPFSPCDRGMLKSCGASEDSSSLCSIIHHLWLQNSLGSPWGYALYPDGETPVPPSVCCRTPSSTGVYKQSPHFHTHNTTIKNKSKTNWCKPCVNLMLAVLNPLTGSKSFISMTGSSLKSSSNDDIVANVTGTVYPCNLLVSYLFLSLIATLYIFTRCRYNDIFSRNAHLYQHK